MAAPVYLSIVIPAHNEELRLPGTLDRILAYLDQQPYSAEVLVVENGSQDRTLAVARRYEDEHRRIRVLHEERRGKGLAVRRGMLEAAGEYRFMSDADLSMPIEEIQRFLPPALNGYDIAIGSREAPGAVRYGEPAYRHLIGRIYNNMIRLFALPGLQDTQCGFKCFRGAVVPGIFALQTLTGMSFDVEVLYIARRQGLRIVEVPIPWYFNPDSRVRLVEDSLSMGWDLFHIQRNSLLGRYDRNSHG